MVIVDYLLVVIVDYLLVVIVDYSIRGYCWLFY
jgi:hypothetical protein